MSNKVILIYGESSARQSVVAYFKVILRQLFDGPEQTHDTLRIAAVPTIIITIYVTN